ncbi:hypothetical protein [Sphingobacterium cavernae]|uniref:hypothetical protein n=1 Tax=Sphingobacterium cavernae TaxID=2592657 RepID=UPI00122FEBCD|nr:hypothetical protein [Sphingobacterium cavernae]
MKNKFLTYGLIVTVVGIWGYVIYKIFQATQPEETVVAIAKNRDIKEENLSYYTIKKLDSLQLNYRDPINHKSNLKTLNKEQTKAATVEDNYANTENYNYVEPEPEIQIAYLGFIKNEKTNKNTAILQIQDKQYMVGQHESIQGIKLLSIHDDYIRIKTAGEQKTIYK